MRLEHHVERGPAGRGRVVILKVNEDLAGTVDPFITGLDFCAAADFIDQTKLLECAHDLIVETRGAGQIV